MATLVILTAEELKALNPLDRQAARRAARQQPLAQLILRTFLERGGPIPVEDIISILAGAEPGTIHDALVALDAEDLIRVRTGQIDLAYPRRANAVPSATLRWTRAARLLRDRRPRLRADGWRTRRDRVVLPPTAVNP